MQSSILNKPPSTKKRQHTRQTKLSKTKIQEPSYDSSSSKSSTEFSDETKNTNLDNVIGNLFTC